MLRICLKSKIHNAVVTGASVDYVGSITIPEDLMDETDLWDGEKVLVASCKTGKRLETYVLTGEVGSGKIEMNGAAAHEIGTGEQVIIMAFGITDKPLNPKIIFCNSDNQIVGRK